MSKTQSNAYDLCYVCKHFRHSHGDVGCYANHDCKCKGFVELPVSSSAQNTDPPENVKVDTIGQAVAEYQQYLKLIQTAIDNHIPTVRSIDKVYSEEVARKVINMLDSNGWKIVRK